ncbi:MAG: hypothetical protein WCK27_30620, partial [Verrucomicrobiota bacterium]
MHDLSSFKPMILLFKQALTYASDHVVIQNGLPVVFNFPGLGTVSVTPLGLTTPEIGGGTYSSPVNAEFLFTPVPEPTTMIAGALLLLPFGASTLRMLRRRTA